MGIDPIVSMAVSMKQQNLREGAAMSVMKMALDDMESSGQDILEMMTDGGQAAPAISLDPSLGNIVDISV